MAKLKLTDIKVGGVYKMKTDQLANWGIVKGDSVEVVYIQGHHINVVAANGQQLSVPVSQLDYYTKKRDQIEEEILDAQTKVDEGKAKLKWMDDTKNEEFDEDEFKVWHTLQTLKDPNLSDIERAKVIAGIIKK